MIIQVSRRLFHSQLYRISLSLYLALVVLVPNLAWSKLGLEDTAGFKGFLDDSAPAQRCVERFSLASAYAFKQYDIKSGIYQSAADLRADSPAVSKLISLVFHRIGEETPRLTKLEPVASLSEGDLLILISLISKPSPLSGRTKELCQIFENTVGTISRGAGGIAEEFPESSVQGAHESAALIALCRASLYPEPHASLSAVGAPTVTPDLLPGGSAQATLASLSSASSSSSARSDSTSTLSLSGIACGMPLLSALLGTGVCGDSAPSAGATADRVSGEGPRSAVRFEFIQGDQVRELIQARKRLRELRASGGLISQSLLKSEKYLQQKLEQQFTFLSLLAQSLEHPMTSRVIGAIYLQKSSRNLPDLSKDGIVQYLIQVSDACLSAHGIQLKRDLEKHLRGDALTSSEEARIQALKTAYYSLPASPVTRASLEGVRDFGEKLFALERMVLDSAPAPRRLIYRSMNNRKEHSELNFADCAETGLFNIIQSVFSKDNNLEIDLPFLRSKSRVLADWFESRALSRILDQDAYDEFLRDHWNLFLNHINQSTPLHLLTNREGGGKRYEIQADMSNLFKLMKHLFPGCSDLRDLSPVHHSSVPMTFASPQDQAARSATVLENFRVLSHCLSRDSRGVEFSSSYFLNWEETTFKAEHSQVMLQINGKKALEMNMGANFISEAGRWTRVGHFGIKDNIEVPPFWTFAGP